MTNVFVKHWRLVVLALGIILFLLVLYWLRTFVLPFAVGLVLAYLLRPVVLWLERHIPPRRKWPGFRRVIAVLIAFLLLVVLLAAFLYTVLTAVIDATIQLVESAPYFIGQSILHVQEWIESIIANLPISIQEEVTETVVEGGIDIGTSIRDSLLGSIPSISATFNIILGFAVLPFFLFYVLKDSEKLKAGVKSALPESIVVHIRNVLDIVERVVGRYLKSQIMLGFIVGYFSFVGLLLLDVPFPLALALLAGVTELIPTLGPWIGGSVAGIVTLAMAPEKTIWVVLLFIGIQALENNLLVPKVQSAFLRIHPAVMIFLLVFGLYIAGFWGILLIGPITAMLVEVVKYVRECMKQQECPELVPPDA